MSKYSISFLLQQMRDREKQDNELQGYCPNCRRGMYKTERGTVQCENCELEQD